jgi:CDP-diacylglycerol--glycerol-3-phosphate 3-phosphatidyltransferase
LFAAALNVPNLITLSRLALSGVLFVLISTTDWWYADAVLFAFAAATDFVDGYIARKYGLVTVLGRILDPFVDKIIICGTFVFLAVRSGSTLLAWTAVVVMGREMFITGLRSFLEQRGCDFSATMSGKLKMVVQCVAAVAVMLMLGSQTDGGAWAASIESIAIVLLWATILITLYSGVEYVFRAARLLRP